MLVLKEKMFIFQDQSIRVFLVTGSPKDIGTLFVALTRRLENLRSTNGSANAHPAKRKLPEESKDDQAEDQAPPEKDSKKM